MKKFIFPILGIFLIVLTIIWIFFITSYLEAMPNNYYRYEEQDGMNSLSPKYGVPPSIQFPHHNTQEIKALDGQGNNLRIQSHLQATNMDTGEKFLEQTRIYSVNKFTRANQVAENGYFLFPPNTQQHDYFLTFPIGFSHAVYHFEGTDVIEGLAVDVFTCKSDPYDITSAIPLFKNYKVESVYTCKILVEPVTGQDVDYRLSWESYYVENGAFGTLAEKGYKETTPEYIAKYVQEAKNGKIVFDTYNQFIPMIIAVSGSTLLIYTGMLYRKKSEESSNSKLIQNVRDLEQAAKVTTDEIIKSAKLVTLGQLSANLSHDIRNGLQSIVTSAQLISERNKNLSEDDRASIQQIKQISERLRRQINDIMTFVRTTPLQLHETTINEIIDAALAKMEIPPNVTIVKPENNAKIYCDQTKMESVIFNIIANAIEEMNEDGKIIISVEDSIRHSIISIQDSGHGIPEENLNKVFDPLFTTKSAGTGLGLAICKNIINEHNGLIEVKNNPTTFTITLPKKSHL